MEHEHQAERRRDDDQTLRRRDEIEEAHDLRIGRGEAVEFRTPDRLNARLQKQKKADRRDHVMQRRRVAQAMKDEAIRQNCEKRHDKRRSRHGDPVIRAERTHEVKGRIGSHHVESTVGEVGDVENPVNERETKGHERIDAPERQPVQNLLKKDVQGAASSSWAPGSRARPRFPPGWGRNEGL
jgi:hypothetical protein